MLEEDPSIPARPGESQRSYRVHVAQVLEERRRQAALDRQRDRSSAGGRKGGQRRKQQDNPSIVLPGSKKQ